MGLWQGALGYGAPVQSWRPLVQLSYLVTRQAFGTAPWVYHLTSVALHAFNAWLLLRLLRRRYAQRAAFGAALLFAVLPVHNEAVAYVSGRSELLLLAWLLLAWLDLEPGDADARARNLPRGLAFFSLALLSKEQAVMFPAVLALWDRALGRASLRDPERRSAYAWLALLTGAYLLLRTAVLGRPFELGFDYFGGQAYLVRLLSMSRFALVHYLFPMATGLGLRTDYSQPLIGHATPGDWAAWLCLAVWAGLLAQAAGRLALGARGARASFWIWAAFLFLLPVSNLLLPFNVIGAQRYLYVPSAAFCVLSAQALSALGRPGTVLLPALALYYGGATLRRNRIWRDEKTFYSAAARENPFSAGAKSGLGVALAREGRLEEAVRTFEDAIQANPAHPMAYYNLGKIHYERGDLARAQERFQRAAERDPGDPDLQVFLGLVAERSGHPARAEGRYRRALELRPWDALARYNLGLLLAAGREREGRARMREVNIR